MEDVEKLFEAQQAILAEVSNVMLDTIERYKNMILSAIERNEVNVRNLQRDIEDLGRAINKPDDTLNCVADDALDRLIEAGSESGVELHIGTLK